MKNLRRWLSPFRKLQWKLTFTYMSVTVTALIVLQAFALVVAGQRILYNSPLISAFIVQTLSDAGQEAALMLQEEPYDRAALQAWLENTFENKDTLLTTNHRSFRYVFRGSFDLLALVDLSGRVLATSSAEKLPPDARLLDHIASESCPVVEAALAGSSSPQQLYRLLTDDQVVAAAPVFSKDSHQVIGVIYLQFYPPAIEQYLFSSSAALRPVLMTIFFSGLVGTIFGTLVAHGFARRLKSLTHMTAGWGKGDFSRRIKDNSGDEIGLLTHDLNQTAAELQLLVRTRQDMATMEERNRLARDLHDSIKQQVFAIVMNLGAARAAWESKPDEARSGVEEANRLARQAQTDLNALIHALRPVQLEEKGLVEALREQTRIWANHSGVTLAFFVEGKERKLPAEVEQALFRTTQEAFANIARHSHASAASLTLNFEPGQVCMNITDNGHGFDPGASSQGIGIYSMHERMRACGGAIEIESSPNGTKIKILVPVAADGENENGPSNQRCSGR